MNRLIPCFLALALLFGAAGKANAQLFNVFFDENGGNFIQNSERTFLPSANMPDPFDPGNGLRPLVFDFGIRSPGLTNGDVLLMDGSALVLCHS